MPHSYPHMCRDGHQEIGHSDPKDDERCPLCRAADDVRILLGQIDHLRDVNGDDFNDLDADDRAVREQIKQQYELKE